MNWEATLMIHDNCDWWCLPSGNCFSWPEPSSTTLCFSGLYTNKDCRPGFWLAVTYFNSAIAKYILTNLVMKQFPTQHSLQSVPTHQHRWRPLSLIGWEIYDFSSINTEQILTKIDRKQVLDVLYQVFFGEGGGFISNNSCPGFPLAWAYKYFTSSLHLNNTFQVILTVSQ